MIFLELPATATCDHRDKLEGDEPDKPTGPQCDAVVKAELALNTTGGWGFELPKEWQAMPKPDQMTGPWHCRCPKHHVEKKVIQGVKGNLPKVRLQVGPSGPRITMARK